MKKFLKKAVAVMVMAAAVITAIPVGNAQAASDCNHKYNRYCLGYKWHCSYNHTYKYYTKVLFIEIPNYIDCTCNVVYHGDRTECADCGALNGFGEHHGATIHQDCPQSEYPCSGTGSVVASLY
ncbi:MAG: hypothetical protein ACI4QX_01720 [Lachnospiraceae bacterium]